MSMNLIMAGPLAVVLLLLTVPPAAALDQCNAPDDVAGIVADIPHVAARLAPGKTLEVLAIGSATTTGAQTGASASPGPATGSDRPATSPSSSSVTRDASFPAYMSTALEAAVLGAEIRLTVRGGRGLTAAEMLDILRRETGEHTYQLVIWQTGTVEAVRNLPPGDFAATLAEGATLAQSAQADLILVDPQYSRFLQTNANLDPYAEAFQQVSAMPGVMLFRRYDLMRTWANEGQIDLERTPRSDRQRMIEALHRCLGIQLSRLILSAARS